jgi:hypothetical protein
MGRRKLTLVEGNITKDQILASNFNKMAREKFWRSQPTTYGTIQEHEGFPSKWVEDKAVARAKLLEEDIREPMQGLAAA